MHVRAAVEDDLPHVTELNGIVQQLHHEARPDWFVAPDADAASAWLQATLERDDAFVFVAEDEGQVVGYALATLHRRPATPFTRSLTVLELDQIGVAVARRQRGIGAALVRRVSELASEVGADKVMLTVWDFNARGRGFFASQSFGDAMHRMELG